jgi:hypothetical protein
MNSLNTRKLSASLASDLQLWRGTLADFFRHNGDRRISAAELERAFVRPEYVDPDEDPKAPRIRRVSDRAVLDYTDPNESLTDDGLEMYVQHLSDHDREMPLARKELDRRKLYDVRVRPGTVLAKYVAYMRHRHSLSAAVEALHLMTIREAFHEWGLVPIYDLPPHLEALVIRL